MTDDGQRSHLFIANDSPCGNEQPYNALRLPSFWIPAVAAPTA